MADERATVIRKNDALIPLLPEESRPEFLRRLTASLYRQDGFTADNASSLTNLRMTSLKSIETCAPLANCTSLQSLDLSWCSELSDISALANCTSLQTLNLWHCPLLSNLSLASVCSSLPKLKIDGP